MKQAINCSLAVTIALQASFIPSHVIAEGTQTPIVALAAGAGSGGARYLNDGTYDIQNVEANYSQALLEIVRKNERIQERDRAYLEQKGKNISDSLRELAEKKRTFAELGQRASTSTKVTLDEYLHQVNELNALIEKIRIDIIEASLINTDTLPSSVDTIGETTVTSSTGSVINMSSALNPFVETLNTVTAQLNDTQFMNIGHKGAYKAITTNALNPDLSGLPLIDRSEMEQKLVELKALKTISAKTQREQQWLADGLVRTIKAYVKLVGTDEFMRFRNENDRIFAAEAYKKMEQAFFMRSYLRKKYGLLIGAIQPKTYPMVSANLERVVSKELLLPLTTAIESVISQTAKTDHDLMTAYNNARQFVEAYDRALTPILSEDAAKKRAEIRQSHLENEASLGQQSLWQTARSKAMLGYKQALATFASGEEIASSKTVITNEEGRDIAYNSQDAGILARLSGALTFATGQVSTTEAILAAMRLVLADIREEYLLSQGDWSGMLSYHSARFMTTPDLTARSVKWMCDLDNTLPPAARERARVATNNQVSCALPSQGLLAQQNSNANQLVTRFRDLIRSYDTVEMKRAQDARSLSMLIERSMSAQSEEGDSGDFDHLFQ